MNQLSHGVDCFGRWVERRKVVLLSGLFLTIPISAFLLSITAPAFGQRLFEPLCHQISNRSLHLPAAMPICARCFGLYLGFGLTGLFLPAFSLRLSQTSLAIGLFLSLTFMILRADFPIVDSNAARLITGLLVGMGAALFLKSVLLRKPLILNPA